MPRLHTRFKNFKPSTVEAAEALFETAPWRFHSNLDKVAVGQQFVDAVVSAYPGYASPKVVIRPGGMSMVDYVPAILETDSLGSPITVHPAKIILEHWSILSLFAGTRVHLLANGEEATSELDPLAWSCSLFYAVRPKMFRARVREGRVLHVAAVDTFKQESWQRLVVAGVADEATGTLRVSPRDALAVLNGSQSAANAPEGSEEPNDVVEAAERFLSEQNSETSDDGLDALNRDAIRGLAAFYNVPGRGRMDKPTLVAKLREMGVRAD